MYLLIWDSDVIVCLNTMALTNGFYQNVSALNIAHGTPSPSGKNLKCKEEINNLAVKFLPTIDFPGLSV